MFLDEALAELGIDLNASVEDARRAYLRLLKTRKPEVDREGFMRLREAYERVRAELPLYEALRKAREATPAEPSPDERVLEQPIVDDSRAGTHVPWSEPPEEPRQPEPIAVVEPKVVEEPKPSVGELLLQGKVKTATKRARRLYRDATRQGEDTGDLPAVRTTLRLLLTLHQAGYTAEAAGLQKDFVAWLDTTGFEARIITGDLAVLWSVARELSSLSGSFPAEMRYAIARSALAGDLAEAEAQASEFSRDQPLLARVAAEDLRAHTTSLASLANVLDPPMQRSAAEPGWWERAPYWVLVPIVMGFIRLLTTFNHPSPRTYSPPSYNLPHQLDGGAGGARSSDALDAGPDGGETKP